MVFAEKAKCKMYFVVAYILLSYLVFSQPLIDTSNAETARYALQKVFGYLSADDLELFDETAADSFSSVMDMFDASSYMARNGSLPDCINGTKWERIFEIYEKYAKEKCESLELESEECAADCFYYNNVLTWISLIAANDSFSKQQLTRMTGFYSISAGPLSYGDDGNEDMCAFWGGNYCYTPAVIGTYPMWQHACCIPGSCVGDDALKILTNNNWCYKVYAERMRVSLDTNVTNICEPIPRNLDKFGPCFVITLFFVFLFFVVVASIIYRYFQELQSVIDNVFILSFNIESLYSSFVGLRSNSSLNFLDGIRVWSMTWVILGHSYIAFWSAGASNILTFNGVDMLTMVEGGGSDNVFPEHSTGFKYLVQHFYTIFLQYAFYSVDSFFFLSGLLAAFSIWRNISKYGSSVCRLWYLWMPFVYLMRIFRIVPMMMFTTALEWQLADQIPFGYHVTDRHTNTDSCDDGWYKILFFYANLTLPPDGGDSNALQCMGHLWYLQIDMQCFIFLPFMLLLFAYNKLYGLLISLVPTAICVIIRLYYAFYYDFSANEISPNIPAIHDGNQNNMSYMQPWTRMSVYFIGVSLMFIFLMIDEKYKENKFTLEKVHYFALILLSSFIMLSLVVWPYQDIKDEPNNRWNLLSNQFYYALSRPAWGIALALLTFALKYMNNVKQKSVIKAFLSLEMYQPLGKLTFLMYLLHMPIFAIWSSDLSHPAYYTGWNELMLCVGVWFISAFLALILWFVMEKPIANLVNAFFKCIQKYCNNKHKQRKQKKNEELLLLNEVLDDDKEATSSSLRMGAITNATVVVEE